jgi:hypothetical protein
VLPVGTEVQGGAGVADLAAQLAVAQAEIAALRAQAVGVSGGVNNTPGV